MRGARLLTIGTEVLNGFVNDTNTGFLARELFSLGIPLREARIVADDRDQILSALREYLESGDFIITTGGLGPTDDDLTVDCLCEVFKCNPKIDEEALRKLERVLGTRVSLNSRATPEQVALQGRKQVRLPEVAEALKNRAGLAPGIWIEQAGLVSLPGFPREIESIWPHARERIRAMAGETSLTEIIPIWGVGESSLFADLKFSPGMEVGVHALPLGCRLFLSGKESATVTREADQVRENYADSVIDDPLKAFAEFLIREKKTIATVESCTGGLAAKLLTDVPGISAVYRGSIVAYHNEIKTGLLGVDAALLAENGAVSAAVSVEMARQGRAELGTDWCVSFTGIAGPSGGSAEKPVGTVHMALACPDGIYTGKFFFPLGRERFRMACVYTVFLALYQKEQFYRGKKGWEESPSGRAFRKV